ncbi:restriction endonuclease subunit S [Snuella lapsa]|uniref:Type I restriction modification DNA specificity domain-containing protein n=1 Tax=Snuella lapsa TaxID=870481 RepID=A0ABP6X0T6_9FLAO
MIIQAPKDVKDQREIAKTISVYDQKITLLREQNQTLEELAQTLFKRWFVEFEFPNENGQPYKSSGGNMVDSELGEIPEGWRIGVLGELSNLKSGYAFKSKDFVDSSCIKAIKIKDLKGKGVVEISDVSSVSEQVTIIERVKYFKLDKGDIVLAMSGNTTGKIGVIPPHDNELYLNQRVGKFFLKDPSYKSFVYNFLMSGNYEERILSMGYGSAQPNINPSQIESIEVLIPRDEILTDYIGTSEPIYNKVLINNAEIQSLIQLRDTLLPKLMSGELKIKFNE